jgi:hypothetical protein
MGNIIALFILALAVLITAIVLVVKYVTKAIDGDIPVPRSSERTMEERLQAEIREETFNRRAELRRGQFIAERLQEANGNPSAYQGIVQALGSMIQPRDQILGEQRVEAQVTHTPSQTPQQPGQKDPKPTAPHHKSRYERDPVI